MYLQVLLRYMCVPGTSVNVTQIGVQSARCFCSQATHFVLIFSSDRVLVQPVAWSTKIHARGSVDSSLDRSMIPQQTLLLLFLGVLILLWGYGIHKIFSTTSYSTETNPIHIHPIQVHHGQGGTSLRTISTAKPHGTNGHCPELNQAYYDYATPDAMTIAFFIRGTKSAAALIRLLDTIYLEQHVYLVHLDQKTNDVEQQKLSNHLKQNYPSSKNIFTFDHPYEVHYMSFDLLYLDIRAVLFFLHLTKQRHIHQFSYFINLSAQEYPLVDLNELHQLLNHHNGKNFIEIWCSYKDAPKYKQNRIDDQWFHGKRISRTKESNSDKPLSINFQFGSFYVVLTFSFLDALFTNPDMLNVLTYLRHTRVPDEVFFATAIMNSKEYKCTHLNTNLRFVNWGRSSAFQSLTCKNTGEKTDEIYGQKYLKGGSHPCILGMKDVQDIQAARNDRRKGVPVSPPWFLFGNKFDDRIDSVPLNYIDQIVQKGKRRQMKEVGQVAWHELKLAERIVPNRLHCPVYNGKGS